jgi:hypothetical protein
MQGFGIVFTLLTSFLLYIFVNYPETLRSMVTENPAKQRDLEKLLAWGREYFVTINMTKYRPRLLFIP